MLIANAKIAPQGSVFFLPMGNRDHFQGFSTHKPLDLLSSLGREGKLSKSTQLKTSLCQQVGHWADILGGTTTGVNPRSSTVRRGTG